MSRKDDELAMSAAAPHTPESEKVRKDHAKALEADERSTPPIGEKVSAVSGNPHSRNSTEDKDSPWASLARPKPQPEQQGKNLPGQAGQGQGQSQQQQSTAAQNLTALEIKGQHLRLEPGWDRILVGQKGYCKKAIDKFLDYYAHYSYYQMRRQQVNTRKFRGVMIDVTKISMNNESENNQRNDFSDDDEE